jgi:hypothetical protein
MITEGEGSMKKGGEMSSRTLWRDFHEFDAENYHELRVHFGLNPLARFLKLSDRYDSYH